MAEVAVGRAHGEADVLTFEAAHARRRRGSRPAGGGSRRTRRWRSSGCRGWRRPAFRRFRRELVQRVDDLGRRLDLGDAVQQLGDGPACGDRDAVAAAAPPSPRTCTAPRRTRTGCRGRRAKRARDSSTNTQRNAAFARQQQVTAHLREDATAAVALEQPIALPEQHVVARVEPHPLGSWAASEVQLPHAAIVQATRGSPRSGGAAASAPRIRRALGLPVRVVADGLLERGPVGPAHRVDRKPGEKKIRSGRRRPTSTPSGPGSRACASSSAPACSSAAHSAVRHVREVALAAELRSGTAPATGRPAIRRRSFST